MKVGVIGSGVIADLCVDALKKIPAFTLQNIYSRSLKKAQKKQAEWGFNQSTDHMSSFLTSDIDIIYIATPNSLHAGQVKDCLYAQKHVICEKPMVTNLQDFNKLYQLADEKNLFLFEAFRHINSPNYGLLKQKLSNIGQLRLVQLGFSKYSSQYDAFKRGENPNVFNPKLEGGALNDLGVYPIALAMGLFGTCKSFSYNKIKLSNGIDGLGCLTLEYEGFLCQISFSKVCTSHIKNEILGEKGAILIDKVSTLSGLTIAGKLYNLNIKPNDIVYEMTKFLNIIQNDDKDEYKLLRDISYKTCQLIEKIRSV